VQYSADSGKTWTTVEEEFTGTSAVISGLDLAGNTYYFRMRLQKTNPQRGITWSQYSDNARLSSVPASSLEQPVLYAAYNSAKGIGLQFYPVEGATAYTLMKKEKGTWTAIKEVRTSDLTLENGRYMIIDESVKDSFGSGFIYSAFARKNDEVSTYDMSGIAIYRLEAPSIASVKVSGTSATVSWTKTEAQGYELQYSPDNGKTWLKAPVVSDTSTSVSGLTPKTAYMFRVRCEKTNADRGTTWSSYSSWAKGVTD
jgi:hypothetical protein